MTRGRQFERFSPGPIVRLHFRSLRPVGVDHLSAVDRVLMFGLPVTTGLGVGLAVSLGLPLADGVSQVLAATALLVGAMLTSFVFLTNLRIKVSESATYAFRITLQKLIGGTAVACLYIAGLAAVTAGLLVAVATIEPLRDGVWRAVMAGLITTALAHLGINLLSVARRLFGVYYDIFAADFSDDEPTRKAAPKSPSRSGQRNKH